MSCTMAKQQDDKWSAGASGPVGWHDHFMNVAKEAARRSKDPACRVGAALVSRDNRLLAEGYNCMPRGRDDLFPWEDKAEKLNNVCHAEMNCIVNAACGGGGGGGGGGGVPRGCRMYVTRVPCGACAKLLAQCGVARVYYVLDKHGAQAKHIYSLLDGFELTEYVPENPLHAN